MKKTKEIVNTAKIIMKGLFGGIKKEKRIRVKNPKTNKIVFIKPFASLYIINYNHLLMISLPNNKQKVIEMFAQHKGDTGSPEVQSALLTQKINRLSVHLKENEKDNHSRRGLLKIIAKRRRILNYLKRLDEERYKKLIKNLGLKK